jgi:hypothetical protein
VGDLPVGQAVGEEWEDLPLAPGQRGGAQLRRGRGGNAVPPSSRCAGISTRLAWSASNRSAAAGNSTLVNSARPVAAAAPVSRSNAAISGGWWQPCTTPEL